MTDFGGARVRARLLAGGYAQAYARVRPAEHYQGRGKTV